MSPSEQGLAWRAPIRLSQTQLSGLLARPEVRGAAGLVLLLIAGTIFTPRTMSLIVWQGMMPFVAILGFAAIGQHLVIQQRGFDLSVAGSVSVAAVVVSALPRDGGLTLTECIALATIIGIAAGAVSGLAVTAFRIAPVVATIGVNALLLGVALRISGGTASITPEPLVAFASSRIFGVPTIFVVLLVVTAAISFVLARTSVGRRFVAAGTSLAAARILAIPVNLYRVVTYATAGLFFAVAGILLAGYLNTPVVLSGTPYMLTSVAAFIVGGNNLSGDTRNSVVATIIGAVFLTYLDQVLVSLGFPRSAQSIIQAVIVFAGVALPEFVQRRRA
jgi:ribose/xylose/arabinose/galactoside ABC-type transport system permease subunit